MSSIGLEVEDVGTARASNTHLPCCGPAQLLNAGSRNVPSHLSGTPQWDRQQGPLMGTTYNIQSTILLQVHGAGLRAILYGRPYAVRCALSRCYH